MTTEFQDIFKEWNETTQKLAKGYQTLLEMEEVQVAYTPKELVWEEDHVKMYRYKRETPATCKVPLLVSFALLNRHDVLDLQEDRSLMKKLLDEGCEVYIMDWGYPTVQHQHLTMEDYILGYMNNAVDYVRESTGNEKINKMGICQGGTFSMIYSSIFPEKINSITTLVAPYEFDIEDDNDMLFRWAKDLDVDAFADAYNMIPADMLNEAFGMLKPSMGISKYLGMMDSLDDKAKLENFMRMEIWKADCPDLPSALYRKYIKDLFRDNKLLKGEMTLGEHKVDLSNVTMPALTIYASGDNIIPPCSTKPVMDVIGSKDKELYEFKGGHIGVMVGGRSQKELGPAIAAWLTKRSK